MPHSLSAVMELMPNLSLHGFVWDVFDSEIAQHERNELAQCTREFDLTVQWLQRHEYARTEALNLRVGSYRWKHAVERDVGVYIASGVFIAAAVALNYQLALVKNTDDVCINLSSSLLKVNELVHTCAETVRSLHR